MLYSAYAYIFWALQTMCQLPKIVNLYMPTWVHPVCMCVCARACVHIYMLATEKNRWINIIPSFLNILGRKNPPHRYKSCSIYHSTASTDRFLEKWFMGQPSLPFIKKNIIVEIAHEISREITGEIAECLILWTQGLPAFSLPIPSIFPMNDWGSWSYVKSLLYYTWFIKKGIFSKTQFWVWQMIIANEQ